MKIYQYNIDGEQFFVAADTQDQSDFAIMEDGLCDPEERATCMLRSLMIREINLQNSRKYERRTELTKYEGYAV